MSPISNVSDALRFIGTFVCLSVFVGIAGADTDVTVNDTRDLADASPNSGPDCASTAGTCTLRAAIQRANHQIGTHTIRLPAGTFTLTRVGTGENDAVGGDLDVKGKLVVIGAGANQTTVAGTFRDRVFDLRSGSLTLQGLTVRDGDSASEAGGGIRTQGGSLSLNRVHVLSNRSGSNGGGIAVDGGASVNSDVLIVRSTISGNQAAGAGGGIAAKHTAVFRHPKFSLRETTVSGNTDFGNAGGVLVGVSFDVSILHSTIAFNDFLGLNMVTNGLVTIDHTIFSDNQVNCFLVVAGTGVSTETLNVDSDASCEFNGLNGNLVNVDPQLSALADNGGQTPTHLFNNPALIDAGDLAGPTCSGLDQRNLFRPRDFDGANGARCDIGAVELQGRVGVAVLHPDKTAVRRDVPFLLDYLWRVPGADSWHSLKTLDLRIVASGEDARRNGRKDVQFWLRWFEASDTVRLIDVDSGRPYGDAMVMGAAGRLETGEAVLDLGDSETQGSGPTGPDVTLRLALTLKKLSQPGRPFRVEVTGTDDHGNVQPFLPLGALAVRAPRGR